MSGNGAGSLRGWVVVDAVLCAFAQQDASVPFQVTNQIGVFHMSGDRHLNLFALNVLPGRNFAREFTIGCNQNGNCVAQVLTRFVDAVTLRYSAREFLDVGDIATAFRLWDFLKNSRENHIHRVIVAPWAARP